MMHSRPIESNAHACPSRIQLPAMTIIRRFSLVLIVSLAVSREQQRQSTTIFVKSMVVTTPATRTPKTVVPEITTTTSRRDHLSSDQSRSSSQSTDRLRKLLEGGDEEKDGHAKNSRIKPPSAYTIDTSSSTMSSTSSSTTKSRRRRKQTPALDQWRDYEVLRGTDLEDSVLSEFFFGSGWDRKRIIADRFLKVLTTCYAAREDWINAQRRKKMEGVKSPEVNAGDLLRPVAAPSATDDPDAIRLCEAVASLGPLAVKLGQTLSQRPDIVGKDTCVALKRLQTQNTPFSNSLARNVLRESLGYWDGPLAANLDEPEWSELNDSSASTTKTRATPSNAKPLFRYLSPDPIASASLGQVYKATTWEGREVALKIQRPDALSILAIDTQCFRITCSVRKTFMDWAEQWNAFFSGTTKDDFEHTPENGMTEEEVRAAGNEGTIASVIDRVARDVNRELDFRIEAANSYRFRDSLSFLGFVDTPDVLLATDKVLATRFVNGHHLQGLKNPRHELALTRMAVEACTASLVLTGFVHADPHEGNLMFREDDGRIVFLDFGLMSEVDRSVMEAFARGIQAMLSEDFLSVTEAWADTGFVTTPVMHRNSLDDLWRVDPAFGLPELAADMEYHTKNTEGGLSRFGALATILNKKISPNWLVFTPPYVLLLIRTFLTLEGIAGQVDPEFNIYEMSMPWVVRRSLSPSTEQGRRVLRNIILKEDNTIQWERILELMELQKEAARGKKDEETSESGNNGDELTSVLATSGTEEAASDPSATAESEIAVAATASIPAAQTPEELERKRELFAAARQAAMKDAVGTLLGSADGRALRDVLKDLDTPDLIWKLGSKEGRPILKFGTEAAIKALFGKKAFSAKPSEETRPVDVENYRPVSDECQQIRAKQADRSKQVTRILFKKHVRKCLLGVRGPFGVSRLVLSALQIVLTMVTRGMMRKLVALLPHQKHRLWNAAPPTVTESGSS